jgi:hypothetical protein
VNVVLVGICLGFAAMKSNKEHDYSSGQEILCKDSKATLTSIVRKNAWTSSPAWWIVQLTGCNVSS